MSKKISMVIAPKDFKDEEYFVPKKIFEESGFVVKTLSFKKELAIGIDGGEALVDLSFNDFYPKDFDAIVFVGGNGASIFFDNEDVERILQESKELDQIIAAICIAPVLLAKNGILEGKRATVWSNNMDTSLIQLLEASVAQYVDLPVVMDGNVITARGPAVAKDFANTIINALDNL
jgi:protease I